GESLDREGEAISLVTLWPAQGQHDCPALVERRRVRGRLAVLLYQPALGDPLLASPIKLQLAGRYCGRSHVDEDRAPQFRWERDADGVGAEAGARPPKGATALAD